MDPNGNMRTTAEQLWYGSNTNKYIYRERENFVTINGDLVLSATIQSLYCVCYMLSAIFLITVLKAYVIPLFLFCLVV